MKIKFYAYVVNCGDGSVSIKYFKNKDNALKYEKYEEEGGETWAESSLFEHEIDIDLETKEFTIDGKASDPIHYVEEEALKELEKEAKKMRSKYKKGNK